MDGIMEILIIFFIIIVIFLITYAIYCKITDSNSYTKSFYTDLKTVDYSEIQLNFKTYILENEEFTLKKLYRDFKYKGWPIDKHLIKKALKDLCNRGVLFEDNIKVGYGTSGYIYKGNGFSGTHEITEKVYVRGRNFSEDFNIYI